QLKSEYELSKLASTSRKPKLIRCVADSFDGVPGSVRELTLGGNFNGALDGIQFPPKLTHLTFDWAFNQPVDHRLPSTLTHLMFGQFFNHPVDNLPGLTHLTFGGF